MPRDRVFIFSKGSHRGAMAGPCIGELGIGTCAFAPCLPLSQHLLQPSSQLGLPGPRLVPAPSLEVSAWCAQFTNLNCPY